MFWKRVRRCCDMRPCLRIVKQALYRRWATWAGIARLCAGTLHTNTSITFIFFGRFRAAARTCAQALICCIHPVADVKQQHVAQGDAVVTTPLREHGDRSALLPSAMDAIQERAPRNTNWMPFHPSHYGGSPGQWSQPPRKAWPAARRPVGKRKEKKKGAGTGGSTLFQRCCWGTTIPTMLSCFTSCNGRNRGSCLGRPEPS
jgi:hypothetical protein